MLHYPRQLAPHFVGQRDPIQSPNLRTRIVLAREFTIGISGSGAALLSRTGRATLTNLAKQVQRLQTPAHAQLALTDVFLKYVITCLVEPPEDALPAARVRAKLCYEKLVRAAAEGISNRNKNYLTRHIFPLDRTIYPANCQRAFQIPMQPL
jgi:hypothetical protein